MDELVKRLRCQRFGNCPNCPMWYTEEVEPNLWRERCAAIDAADAIEELVRFAHFVAQEVVVTDEEWELNNLAFPEIICRKLNNLGVVSKAGEMWHYEPPKEESYGV